MTYKQLAQAQVARAVQEVMDVRGMNQEQVAGAMGLVGTNNLSRVLHGHNTTIDWLARFAAATGTELQVTFKEPGRPDMKTVHMGQVVSEVSQRIQGELHRLAVELLV